MNAGIVPPKAVIYGLVRDKDGKPKIDGDPRDLPEQIKDMMNVLEFIQAVRDYEESK